MSGKPSFDCMSDLVAPGRRRRRRRGPSRPPSRDDGPARAAGPARDDDRGPCTSAGLRSRPRSLTRVGGCGREDDAPCPRRRPAANATFRPGRPSVKPLPSLWSVSMKMKTICTEKPPPMPPGVLERRSSTVTREVDLVAVGTYLELGEVEGARLVDGVGRVDVGAGAVVVAGRVLEGDLLRQRGAGDQDDRDAERRTRVRNHDSSFRASLCSIAVSALDAPAVRPETRYFCRNRNSDHDREWRR